MLCGPFLQVGSNLLDASGAVVRELDEASSTDDVDDAHLGLLVRETVSEGHAVLVFCATRKVIPGFRAPHFKFYETPTHVMQC